MKTNSMSPSEPHPSRILSAGICLAALAIVTARVFGIQEQPAATPKPIQEGKGHHFVCTDYTAGKVFIVNAEGKVEWEYSTGQCNDLWALPNGNLLFNTGHGVKEVTRQKTVVFMVGQTVWEVKADELPGIGLKFMAGLQRLPNGNTVMSNWLGRGQLGKAPHLIQITRDKRVLWTFFDHQTMTTVSSVQLLDVPGDATKGEVWHWNFRQGRLLSVPKRGHRLDGGGAAGGDVAGEEGGNR